MHATAQIKTILAYEGVNINNNTMVNVYSNTIFLIESEWKSLPPLITSQNIKNMKVHQSNEIFVIIQFNKRIADMLLVIIFTSFLSPEVASTEGKRNQIKYNL